MLKWLITTVLALVLIGALTPLLSRLGFGRLPGDIRYRREGKDYLFPITSTLLLSALLSLLVWMMI